MYEIAVILTDSERKILWVNRDFECITGYNLGDVIGKTPGSILQGPRTEQDAIARIREGLAREEPFKETLINYRKNGEAYESRLVIHPIHNSKKELVNYLAFEVDGGKVKNENRLSLLNLKNRYRTSSLRGIDELHLFDRIKRTMVEDKIYLDPEFDAAEVVHPIGYQHQIPQPGHQSSRRLQLLVPSLTATALRKSSTAYLPVSSTSRPSLASRSIVASRIRVPSTRYSGMVPGLTPKAYADQLMAESKVNRES
jgi:PAS domain S-box-containing protein